MKLVGGRRSGSGLDSSEWTGEDQSSVTSRWSLVLLVLPVGLYGWLAWGRRWVSEDAFINFRVIRNLLDGHGPVFNLGERVEIYTSPLWVAVQTTLAAVLRPVPVAWIAAVCGLVLSLVGLGLALAGSVRRPMDYARRDVAVPFGALVVVALPPFWDFATSGLETGLVFAWLGGSFWALTRLEQAADADRLVLQEPLWTAFLAGLGPVIRPELAIFSATLLIALVVMVRPGFPGLLRLGIAAAALPATYELFRMGYFGAVFPNTAFAKEAFEGRWASGLRYLTDLVGPYWLWFPLLSVAAWWGWHLWRWWRDARPIEGVPSIAMGAGAALYVLYVVRLGGDFMHGRFLLPATFAFIAPAAAIGIDLRSSAASVGRGVTTILVVAWAVVCATSLRVPYDGRIGPEGITDERGYYAAIAGDVHPVTLDDYGGTWYAAFGRRVADRLDGDRVLLVSSPGRFDARELALGADVEADVVVVAENVGILGYAANPQVRLVDALGLGDPIAARLDLADRGRPGHEKRLSLEWVVARFVDPGSSAVPGDPEKVEAARRALRCRPLVELQKAVSDPLTPGRFLRNIAASSRLTMLRIPPDPVEAAARLC